jgi:transcriptional regulator with XRE-family HTH domain
MMTKAPNPVDKHVGARVRMRRLMVGLSQGKLGEALDVTFQQVQKYEKGANRIGASRLQQLARVLEVPPSYFFDGAPNAGAPVTGLAEPDSNAYVVDFLSTSEGLQLNRAFASIKDSKVRKKILDLVETLAAGAENG